MEKQAGDRSIAWYDAENGRYLGAFIAYSDGRQFLSAAATAADTAKYTPLGKLNRDDAERFSQQHLGHELPTDIASELEEFEKGVAPLEFTDFCYDFEDEETE